MEVGPLASYTHYSRLALLLTQQYRSRLPLHQVNPRPSHPHVLYGFNSLIEVSIILHPLDYYCTVSTRPYAPYRKCTAQCPTSRNLRDRCGTWGEVGGGGGSTVVENPGLICRHTWRPCIIRSSERYETAHGHGSLREPPTRETICSCSDHHRSQYCTLHPIYYIWSSRRTLFVQPLAI